MLFPEAWTEKGEGRYSFLSNMLRRRKRRIAGRLKGTPSNFAQRVEEIKIKNLKLRILFENKFSFVEDEFNVPIALSAFRDKINSPLSLYRIKKKEDRFCSQDTG